MGVDSRGASRAATYHNKLSPRIHLPPYKHISHTATISFANAHTRARVLSPAPAHYSCAPLQLYIYIISRSRSPASQTSLTSLCLLLRLKVGSVHHSGTNHSSFNILYIDGDEYTPPPPPQPQPPLSILVQITISNVPSFVFVERVKQ